MHSAITYVQLCRPSFLHQPGMSQNYINFENTHKRPEAIDTQTYKDTKYNPSSSHVSDERWPQLQMNIQVIF